MTAASPCSGCMRDQRNASVFRRGTTAALRKVRTASQPTRHPAMQVRCIHGLLHAILGRCAYMLVSPRGMHAAHGRGVPRHKRASSVYSNLGQTYGPGTAGRLALPGTGRTSLTSFQFGGTAHSTAPPQSVRGVPIPAPSPQCRCTGSCNRYCTCSGYAVFMPEAAGTADGGRAR